MNREIVEEICNHVGRSRLAGYVKLDKSTISKWLARGGIPDYQRFSVECALKRHCVYAGLSERAKNYLSNKTMQHDRA